MIEYFAQGAAQTLQQLGRLQQERYDRLRRPRRGTNTPTTRSPTPRAITKKKQAVAEHEKVTRKDRVKLFHIIQRHLRRKRKTGRSLLISVKDKFKSREKPDHIFRDKVYYKDIKRKLTFHIYSRRRKRRRKYTHLIKNLV